MEGIYGYRREIINEKMEKAENNKKDKRAEKYLKKN